MFYLFIEGGFGNRALFNIDHEAVVGPDETDIEALLELIPLAANHDSISIAVGLWTRDDWCDDARIEATNALKEIADLFVLQFELRRIGDMLILAAAAIAEVTTLGSDPLGRWLNDSQKSSAGKTFFYFRDFDLDDFADLNERNEDDKIFDSRDSFTTECDIGNSEGQVFANSGTHGTTR